MVVVVGAAAVVVVVVVCGGGDGDGCGGVGGVGGVGLCRLVGGNVVIGALSSSKIKEKQKLEAEGRCP